MSERVQFFSRPGCHLCDEARAVVARVCANEKVDWAEINIEEDDDLTERYGEFVPVVVADGEQIGYWHIDAQALSLALTGEQGDPPSRLRRIFGRRARN